MLYGMDLSHYQAKVELSKGTYDFCIIKATEGIGFIDDSFKDFAIQLTGLDKLTGCYHYARPDLHGTVEGMIKEAQWFLDTVDDNGLFGKAILVLDWEREPMDREDLVRAWCEHVFASTGIKPFIYGSRSKLNNWKKAGWTLLNEYPIWSASWPTISRFIVGADPKLKLPSGEWKIWQYSANGLYPQFNGNVDLDMARMSKEDWIFWASGKDKHEKEVITPAMQWCIDNGIFLGDGEGHYFPKQPLTREQAAQLIYNIFNIIDMKNLLSQQNLMLYKSVLNSLYGEAAMKEAESK